MVVELPRVHRVIKQQIPDAPEGFKICDACFFESPETDLCIHPLTDFYPAPNDKVCKRHYHKMQYKSRMKAVRKKKVNPRTGDQSIPFGGKERPPEVPDGWIYASQAAKTWGVSREWVRQLINRGNIENTKVNGRVWVNPDSYRKDSE